MMPKTNKTYPDEFKKRMIGLVREGRTPEALAREVEPSAQAIRNWVAQADREAGRRQDGLTTGEREERQRLRREDERPKGEREILQKDADWFGQAGQAA